MGLASYYSHNGRLRAAEAQLKRALSLCFETRQVDLTLVRPVFNNIIATLIDRGDIPQAEKFNDVFLRTVLIPALGEMHSDTINAFEQKVQLCHLQGKLREAVPYIQKIETYKKEVWLYTLKRWHDEKRRNRQLPKNKQTNPIPRHPKMSYGKARRLFQQLQNVDLSLLHPDIVDIFRHYGFVASK